MPQETSKNSPMDQEQVIDALDLEAIKERVEGLKLEADRFKKSLEATQKSKETALERFKTVSAVHELMLANDNFKKVNPDYMYETLPEYWELRRTEISYQVSDQKEQFNAQIAMADAKIRDLEFSLKSTEDQLALDEETLKKHSA